MAGPWEKFGESEQDGPWSKFSEVKPEKPRTRGFLETANDTVIEVANAAAGGVSSLANFVRPGNQVSAFIDKNIIKAGEEKQSDVVKSAKQTLSQGIQNADGIGGELSAVGKYVVDNPLLAASQAVGSFAIPGGVAKGVSKAAQTLGAVGKGAEMAGRAGGSLAGMALAGGDAAGTAYELSSKAGATDEQALAAGRQASVAPGIVGALTGAFGAEKLLAGGAGFKGGIINRAVKTGLSEAGQEGFEEGITQYEGQRAAMPYDAKIDPTKGVAAAAGMGAIMGGATGAGVSLLTGNRDAAKAPPETPPVDPVLPTPTPEFQPVLPTPVIQPTPTPQLPSEAMGIDPNAGVLSKAAAMAVDTGAHEQTLQAAAEQIQQETAKTATKPPEIAPETQSNLIANEAVNTPASTEINPEKTPIYGSAYAQRQATAPKVGQNDILDTNGQPFVAVSTAKRAADQAGEGFRPFKVGEKQFVVRNFATENIAAKAIDTAATPEIEAQNAPQAKAQTVEAGTPAGTTGATPAATDTPARTGAVETARVIQTPSATRDTLTREIETGLADVTGVKLSGIAIQQRKYKLKQLNEKESNVTQAAQTVETKTQGQASAVPKSVNVVPYENRVNAADAASTRPAAGSGSAVPAGLVLPERSGSDLQARPEVVQKGDEKADLAGEKLNKEWTAFTPESGTLNVPRAEMPQIKAEHRGAMVNFFKARGIESTTEDVAADSLKPTQTEFSTAKVNKAKAYEGGDRSILVSSDGHVLDGHHQWLAKRETGEPVKIIKLNAPIKDLLATVKEFPSAGQSNATQKIATEAVNTPASGKIEAKKPVPPGLAKMREGKAKREAEKASLEHLFGVPQKRAKAIVRIAKGTAYFGTTAKARDFIEANGLKDTHEFVKHASGANRWDVVAKVQAPAPKPVANVIQAAKDSGKLIIANATSKIEAKPAKADNSQDDWKIIGKNKDGKTIVEDKRGVRSYVEKGIRISEPVSIRPTKDGIQISVTHRDEFLSVDELSNGKNDELDAETRSYEAKASPTYSGEPKSDTLNEKEKAAKAKMLNALGKLATLASKNTRMNWTPEEEQKLLPIVIELFDGAMELGAVTFQKAVRYVRDYISKGIDQETADAIPFDTLQGAYIATSGRHKDKGVTPKKEVASFESLAELDSVPEAKTSLTDTFYNAIKSGGMPKDNPALRKMVETFDGKPADNARLKEAQEELEAAIARTTRDVIAKGKGQRETFDELLRVYNSQPLLNIRTSTSIANQAYSTPAPLAYLASELAGITQADTVLEPTGGTGMLIAGANPSKTLANELNDHRAELLRAQGFTVTQDDAANGFKGTFDKVNTNPPFGSIKDDKGDVVKVPVDGYRLGQIDHLIAARALAAMKDEGKATLILGANKVAGGISNDDLIFFNWLYGHYNVAGHFEVEGDLYARQGAGWPVRVISINGRQKSNKTSPIAETVKRADNWSQVYEYFTDSLATSRAESNPIATTSAGGTSTGETDASAVRTNPDQQPTGANQRKPAGSTGSNGDVTRTTAGAVPDSAKPAKKPVGASTDSKRLDATPAKSDRLDTSGDAAGSRADKPATSAGTNVGENQFQSSYIPRSSRKDEGVLIPVNMKEPTQDALSKLEDAVGNIDDFATKELGYANTKELHDALMGLQVDSVASSIYQIKQGKGVVIADQTGIGKGRQAAAIIRWAAKQGHTPVFVTVKPSLFTDMYGDLADIGTNDINPFIMNGSEWISSASGEKLFSNKPLTHKNKLSTIAATGELPTGSNALFLTYSQINVDNVQRKALTALADKAVFILDESHNAGGASATGEFITSVLGAAKGVTYLSATYAKRPDNMPLYFKTDIGQASADNEGLMAAMAAGGLPLQTVVSNNLVKAGQMFRRERSYDGVSIKSKTDSSNQKAHEALSDKTTAALRAIVAADGMFHEVFVKQLAKQLAKEGGRAIDNAGNQAQDSVQHTEFSSVVHNFVRQMLLGLKAQSAADDAIAALKRGEKPIIAVENTMGSFLNEYAAANSVPQGGSLGSFDYRTVLSRALARTRVMTEQKANGEKVKKEIPLSALDGLTQSAYAQAQDVIDGLDLDIPVSPIDWMRSQIQKAGYSVAEITGRSLSVDYSSAPVLSAISAQEQNDKVQTTRLFNSGKLDALILNVAGSTGISLHASEKFTDQRQRHMIVAQPAQDINIFMQMLGRIHRTGQVKLPKYTILSVDLPTEKRPTALLSKKMKSLNANTSSNTESATSVKTADMLNKYGDQIVGQYLHDNYHLTQALGIEATTEDGEAVEDIARKATGRLALQPISVQNAFYAEVEGQYNALLDYLNKTNQNDLEPRTFDFDAKELKQEILFEGADKNTPFGEDAIYGEYSIKAQGLPMKPEEINAEIQENLGGKTSEAHVVKLGSALIKQFEGFYKTLPDGVQQETANKVLAEGKRFLQDHRIGKTFRVDINGDSFNAVVTNIRSTHKTTGNPLSLSKVQVSIAVNGALRHISVPATQFQKIEVSSIGQGYTIEQLFKEQPADQRETAKIVTGNLLAAYGEIDGARGTIINFTKTDGTTEQGILLPKTFDFTKNTRGDFRLSTGAIALKFLQESDNKDIKRFGIMSRDSIVRVLPSGQGIAVLVPKSKLKGAKFFLDKGLIEVLGDFVTAGNYMKATTDKPAEAVNALELLMKKQALYALPSMAEEAKAIAEKSAFSGSGKELDKVELKYAKLGLPVPPGLAKMRANANKNGQSYDSADNKQAVDRLSALVAADLKTPQPNNSSAYLPVSLPEQRSLGIIAGAFGKSATGFKLNSILRGTNSKFAGIAGVSVGSIPDTVFLNAESPRPHLSILGHELAHEIARDNKPLYNELINSIRAYVKSDFYNKNFPNEAVARHLTDADAIREEFIGEVISDGFTEHKFWDALGEKNPTLLKKVYGLVAEMIAKIKMAFGVQRRTEKYFTDFDAVMKVAGEVMAKYGMDENLTNNDAPKYARIGETLKAVTVTDIKAHAGNKLADYRNLALQFLGGRQLADLYGKDIPQIDSYTKMVQQMSADANEVGARADGIVTGWSKLTDERQLAELMHDATLMQIDPAKDYVEGDNRMQWGKLNAQFKALTPEAKKVYTEARDAYEEHYAQVREAIRDKIERSAMGKESKARMLERMDGEFFDKIKGVYFPLSRFGKYVVVTRDGAGNVVNVSRAETLNEAEAVRKQMQTAYPRNSGYAVGKVLKDKEFNASRDAVGRGFLKELFGVLDEKGVGNELQDAVNQLYLASMPDLSWAKHGIHRKGTPGFSQDARRAFAQNMFHGGRYLAKLRYADQLQDKLTSMQDHVDLQKDEEGFDSIKGQQIVDEYVKRHDSLMNPKSNPLSTALTSFGFVFHMGLSPASAMVNLSGTALVAYPIMGAKWGFDKAGKALLMASKQAATNKNDISTVLTGDERAAYDAAVKAGTIDVTAAHDLAGIAQGEDAGVMWKLRPVMKWASFLFHHAERFNRQVTFVASYRLARGTGVNHEAAYEQATRATYDSHFDYSASNRPRVMQGNAARVLLLFKQYGQNMIYTLTRQAQQAMNAETPEARKEARKALGGLLVMHASAAGVLGLPLVGPLLAMASMLGGSDDEPWDAEIALRNMLADTFGQKPAEVMAKGFSRLTPFDLSGRVGLNHLILPDIQEGLEGQRLGESAMAAALGPVAGIGINLLKGMQDISEGHTLRGFEAMMPVALRNPIKALRYEMEGAKDKTGIVIQDEVGAAGIAGQALGFSPSEVRNATEGRSAIYKTDQMLMQRRKELMSNYGQAMNDQDAEAVAKVRESIKKFNEVNPDRKINNLQLIQSLRNKAKRVAEAENGVFLPKNRRSAIEEGRFAVD